MIKLKYILITLCFIVSSSFEGLQAQRLNIDSLLNLPQSKKIIRNASRVSEEHTQFSHHLAKHLTSNCTNDFEKLLSLFVWTMKNIQYDKKAVESGELPNPTPRNVLKNKSGVCEGYANLMQSLCVEANIESDIIYGYSKGYGYKPKSTFTVSDHAWNAAKLNGTWYLMDVTWASGIRPSEGLKRYFLSSPSEFVEDHLPEVAYWQLLNNPVSIKEFEAGNDAIASKLTEIGNYNYLDSIEYINSLNVFNKGIEYQKRASIFNPKNKTANLELGKEYLFNGIAVIDRIYTLDLTDWTLKDLEKHRQKCYEWFNEAAFHFSGFKPSDIHFKHSQVYYDETEYQRGIYEYEMGLRLIETYHKLELDVKRRQQLYYNLLVDKYMSNARWHFESIPFDSWYKNEADQYTNVYIKPFSKF